MKASGNAKEEAECRMQSELGRLFESLSQCDKARKSQGKALGINMEIGDRNKEAVS